MDKSQEGDDNQLSFVGRLSYRSGIGITEDAIGSHGLEVQEGRLTQYVLIRGLQHGPWIMLSLSRGCTASS